jgi:CDGSH-type Zn-finger protein
MTRLVQRLRNGPYVVTVGSEIKSICGCGLSGTLPFCDGTHQITKTEEAGKLHWYDSRKQRHDAVDRYPDIRTDEVTKSTLSARTAPSMNMSTELVSER